MTTIAFYTLGCKSNQYETQLMKSECAALEIVPFDRPADIYVINTCSVTSDADKKSRQAIRKAQKLNPKAQLLATGCYSELQPRTLQNEFPSLKILRNAEKKELIKHLSLPDQTAQTCLPEGRLRANLMIEDGCENFCSYCVVPYARGKIIKRPVEEIVKEAAKMAEAGVKEIILTGINLGAHDKLINLTEQIDRIDGLLRLRLSSIEPMYVTAELVETLSRAKKACRHLHIPLQSGDNDILKSMNRNYTREDYMRIVDQVRAKTPEIAITTDIIVGFPGEPDEAFENTVKLVNDLKFSRMHLFMYSSRSGTKAATLPNQVDPRVKKERYDVLNALRAKYMRQFSEKYLNQPVEVLVEQAGEGLTDNYIRVKFPPQSSALGSIHPLTITSIEDEYCLAIRE